MKKIYLPILATLLVFSSCQCNKNQTGTPTPPTASAGVVSGNATAVMMPPSLTGGPAGNFIIQMNPTGNPPVCNRIHIFVYFPLSVAGSSQQVTVTSAGLSQPMIFTDVQGNPSAIYVGPGTFGTPPAVIANTKGIQMTISVSATVNGQQYQSAILQPLQNGSNDVCGFGVVTFSDGAGHQAVIVAEDEGIMQ